MALQRHVGQERLVRRVPRVRQHALRPRLHAANLRTGHTRHRRVGPSPPRLPTLTQPLPNPYPTLTQPTLGPMPTHARAAAGACLRRRPLSSLHVVRVPSQQLGLQQAVVS